MKNWASQTGKTLQGRKAQLRWPLPVSLRKGVAGGVEALRAASQHLRSLIRLAPLMALLLSACFSLQMEDWPDTIPPSRLFVRAWQEDRVNQQVQPMDEYLYWVRSFYVGTVVYPRGWLDIKRELLTLTNNDERSALAREIDSLGITIGAEWAKLNEGRLIDNRMLALWGSTLQLMVGFDEQMQAIDEVANDIDALFQGDIGKQDITEARYADKLGFEVFGDF